MSLDSLVTWIIVGGIAGLLAEWVIGGFDLGCIGTVLIGKEMTDGRNPSREKNEAQVRTKSRRHQRA